MILSDFERHDSPWVWIQYRTNPRARKRYSKTRVRKDDPEKARKIKIALNQLEAVLLKQGDDETDGTSASRAGGGWGWVPGYLAARYGKSRTLKVYMAHWKALAPFLAAEGIRRPDLLTREHCAEKYRAWRTSQVKEKSRRHPSVNIAIDDLKLLGLVMDEAVARGMADANPARKLRLKREESAQKPEITDAEAIQIYTALHKEPVWMQRSFHIALQTGLRFSETQIPRNQVKLADGIVVIEKPKGGRKREFSIPLYPQIATMLRASAAAGESRLWEVPAKERPMTGLAWTKFFRRIKLPHLCFHCTRVTFITRGARAGVPESAMMAMVNHASKDVHRIYQRYRDSDALRFRELIQIPAPPCAAATQQNPRRRASPRLVAAPHR